MGRPELLVLSLGLSLVLAATTWSLMSLFERRPFDPALREKGWALALYLPVLPIILVGIAMLLPPLVGPLRPALPTPEAPTALVVDLVFHRGVPVLRTDALAGALLALAGVLAMARAARLAFRTLRLRRFIRATDAAPADVVARVEAVARRTAAAMPEVRIAEAGPEAMIAGLFRPVLVLPAPLVGAPALEAVCAHELAHLRRGDHRALWLEEILLTVMAFNPILGLIRVRRAAAREEACDAAALAHAGEAARRLYARSLIDALRASSANAFLDDAAPALTFTSSRRILVMRRLKAILSPVPRSGARHRLTVLGAGLTLAAVAGTASFALAGQRAPDGQRQPVVAPAALALPAARPVASMPPGPAISPRAVAAPAATPRPRVEPAPVAAPAPSETPAAAPIVNPAWVQYPRAPWPQAASADLTSGSAVVSCTAQADGRLADCAVLSEEPVGAGFGPAAVEAGEKARLAPSVIDAGGAGKVVVFTVRFRLG